MKALKMTLFTMVMAILMITSVALAQPPMGERPGSEQQNETNQAIEQRPMRPKPHGPLGQLVKFQHQNLTLAVLAELTGLDSDIIAAELELSHPSEILATYDIDMETFIAAMDEQMIAMIESAVTAGSITEEQGSEIITRIIEKPERPEEEAQE